jgi:methylated-DNA-[protein]-cysteine S-methyltransferase
MRHHDMHWDVIETPIGRLTLCGRDGALTGVRFPGRGDALAEEARRPGALATAAEQLQQYFAGERRAFDLDLAPDGTPFQRQVWAALRAIPYGATVSYGELARTLARPDRARAVGAAVGRTPIPIVIPCHRVIGADGSLTGYGGGLQRKAALLDLEERTVRGLAPEPAWALRQLVLA